MSNASPHIDARWLCLSSSWKRPALFEWLQREGGVAEEEMHRVFNCGIGMVVVVSRDNVSRAIEVLTAQGETVYTIGEIQAGEGEQTVVV